MEPWERYEEVAQHVLNAWKEHFGLDRAESKQTLKGESGASWEIDFKGVRTGPDEAIVLGECRRHTTRRITQEQIGGLAHRIRDTGSDGGIIVSPLGLQAGAEKVAAHENIKSMRLSLDCTTTQYVATFLSSLFASDAIGSQESLTWTIGNGKLGVRTTEEQEPRVS